jgi:hypothetical protein
MRKMVSALSVVALLVIAVAGVVQAEPIDNTGFDDRFYSDSTFTTMVGERYMQCGGGRHSTGVLSDYVYTEEWDCQTEQPSDPPCNFWLCSGGQQYPWEIYLDCQCVEPGW